MSSAPLASLLLMLPAAATAMMPIDDFEAGDFDLFTTDEVESFRVPTPNHEFHAIDPLRRIRR
jgi:hypothetical protein